MNFKPVRTPLVAKKMFPNYIWDIPFKSKALYLTFDDGPTPKITNWILDVLDQYNAKATFFCIGKNIANHHGVFKNILDKGHMVGNHTFDHVKGWRTSTKDYVKNITQTQKIIDSNSVKNSSDSSLFRPPYGQIRPMQGKALNALGFKVVMWNVLSFDWDKEVPKEQCLQNVVSNASEGSIIVFHDSLKAEKNMKFALPKVLEYFSNKGYSFRSIPATSIPE